MVRWSEIAKTKRDEWIMIHSSSSVHNDFHYEIESFIKTRTNKLYVETIYRHALALDYGMESLVHHEMSDSKSATT